MKHDLSDDEGVAAEAHSSGGAKRARVDDHSSLPASSPPPLPSQADDEEFQAPEAGKNDDDEEDAGEDEEMQDEDEDEQTRLTQGVARMKTKTRAVGTVAQAGVIQQVDLQNFMCHTLCTVSFGPQINFLIGNNGSGKSAVLTGISIALGGNAKATNRANKGGDLVKEGTPFALCTVRLKNQGTDAYKKEIYGKSIIVERRINKDMGGSYKIKNAEGKTIDTKKATLDAILDHFNIQVDNPMTVLTQDQSRQFLANSTPKDKYNFFLRGTQLAQLTEEYEQIRANTESMEEALNRKKEVIPELKEAYKRAKARHVEAQAAEGQERRVEQLKDELSWAYVGEKEDKIKAARVILETEANRGPKLELAFEQKTAEAEAASTEVHSIEEAQRSYHDEKRADEINEIKDEISRMTAKLKERYNTARDLQRKRKEHEDAISSFTEALAAERLKLERNSDDERSKILEKIETLTNEQSKLSIDVARARTESKDLEEEYRKLSEVLKQRKEAIGGAEHDAGTCRERINHLKQSTSNPLSNYGNNVPKLQRLIENERGFLKKPIGPLGTYIELKEPQYSSVLESFFAETLNSYLVTSEQDKTLLQRLQRAAGSRSPILKIAEDPSFDCRGGEPDPSVLTILRILSFRDPAVFRALVDSKSIERAALVSQRALGDDLMRTRPYNVQACYSADRFKVSGGDGSSASTSMDPWKGAQRLNPDVAGEIRAAEAEYSIIQADLEGLKEKRNEVDQEMTRLYQNRKAVEERGRRSAQKVVHIKNKIEELNDKLQEEEPSNLASIEEQLQNEISERDSFVLQIAPFEEQTALDRSAVVPLTKKKEQLEQEQKEANKNIGKLAAMLEKRLKDYNDAQDGLSKLQKQKDAHLERLAGYQAEVDRYEAELEENIEQASAMCARPQVDKKKSADKLKQEITTIEKALKERERRQGASLAEIKEQLRTRRETAEKAISTCHEIASLIAALQTAYETRINRWTDFRDQISSRAKMQFLFHLSKRGFTGRLNFDHEKQKLTLRVQTDDAENGATQAGKQKDAKSLSGGEKSFSTICLLLTMWEAVGCPIRCLDEFDVFMDQVNRRISMQMMTDTAKEADSTQFILITPQSVNSSSFRWGPEVRVSKMKDPERGQGTLAVGHA
ncbi:hypothetical protein RQP46_002993 [Phenoliferia psychrophenolica]